MAFNGSGTFVRLYDWTVDRDAGIKILASKQDDELDGIATGLSTCITRDGQSTITANIPLNSNKITGLAAGTAATDAARVDQIQKNTVGWVAAGGTVDAITAAYSPTLTAVAAGSLLGVRASGANTSTTPTFNPDGFGAETITKNGGQALVAGDIFGAGHELLLRKRTTGYELLNPGVTITAAARTVLDDATVGAMLATMGGVATTVTLTAGLGLSGGGDLSANRSFALDFSELTTDAVIDRAADFVPYRDTGEGADNKVLIQDLVPAASDTLAGIIEYADTTEMEAASSATLAVTPGRQHRHPGHPKAWVNYDNNGVFAISSDYGVTSGTDVAVGRADFTFDTAFSATSAYGGVGMGEEQVAVSHTFVGRDLAGTWSTTVFPVAVANGGGAADDQDTIHVIWTGDQ